MQLKRMQEIKRDSISIVIYQSRVKVQTLWDVYPESLPKNFDENYLIGKPALANTKARRIVQVLKLGRRLSTTFLIRHKWCRVLELERVSLIPVLLYFLFAEN